MVLNTWNGYSFNGKKKKKKAKAGYYFALFPQQKYIINGISIRIQNSDNDIYGSGHKPVK